MGQRHCLCAPARIEFVLEKGETTRWLSSCSEKGRYRAAGSATVSDQMSREIGAQLATAYKGSQSAVKDQTNCESSSAHHEVCFIRLLSRSRPISSCQSGKSHQQIAIVSVSAAASRTTTEFVTVC